MSVTYAILHRGSGSVIASFADEAEARAYVEREREPDDDWGLVAFGPTPDDNELLEMWPPA